MTTRRRSLVRLSMILVAVAAAFVALGMPLPFGGPGMCAASRPGSHSTPPLSVYVLVLGPPLLVFLVGGYFALGAKSRRWRVIHSSFVLAVTAFLGIVTMNFVPVCGSFL